MASEGTGKSTMKNLAWLLYAVSIAVARVCLSRSNTYCFVARHASLKFQLPRDYKNKFKTSITIDVLNKTYILLGNARWKK
jgi:hypothetical protein